MRKLLLIALLFACCFETSAQKTAKKATKAKKSAKAIVTKKPTTKGKWEKGGMISLALTQGGSRNWAPGGDRFTIAANGFLNLYAKHTCGRNHLDLSGDFNYGMQNSNAFGIVKNDDKLELNIKWSREWGTTARQRKWRYGVLVNFRTQFNDGFDFDNVPEGGSPKRVSSFLAPGIAVVSPGVDYVTKHVTVHFSPIAGRWILVPNRPYELAANYGVKARQEVKNEFGFFASVGYQGEIIKNVSYRGRLDAYANYVDRTAGNIDWYMMNMIHFRINKYLSAIYSLDFQYDDDTKIFGYNKNRPGLQMKSIFGVGLNVKF